MVALLGSSAAIAYPGDRIGSIDQANPLFPSADCPVQDGSCFGPEVGIAAAAGTCINSSGACLRSLDTTTNLGATTPGVSGYTNQSNSNLGTTSSGDGTMSWLELAFLTAMLWAGWHDRGR